MPTRPWPPPTFEPIGLACTCGHEWDGWQPIRVPVSTWIAHLKTHTCPACGAGIEKLLIRTKPLAEKPEG